MDTVSPRRLGKRVVFVNKKTGFAIMESEDIVHGTKVRSDFIDEEDCVMVLPVLGNGSLIMERQYRAAVLEATGRRDRKGYVYELPGGHVRQGESPEEAAARELEEEVGYRTSKVKILYKRAIAPYATDAMEWVCTAQGLERSSKLLDSDEVISTVKLGRQRILKMLDEGIIDDSLTREALLSYFRLCSK